MGECFHGSVMKATLGKRAQRRSVIKGLLITNRCWNRRPDGQHIQFNQNRAILLEKPTKEQLNANNKMALRWARKPNPMGTKINSAVCKELRQPRLKKIMVACGYKCY